MLHNCMQSYAAAVPASLLAYLIQACAEILVGSGTVTQSQFNDMTATEVFDTTKASAPNIDFSDLPKDPVLNLNLFFTKTLKENPELLLPTLMFKDFVLGHFDSVKPEVDTSSLNGYGALLKKDGVLKTQPDKSWYLGYIYCDYITVEKVFYDGYFSYRYQYFGDFKLIATDGFTVMDSVIITSEDFSNRSDDDISVYGDVRFDDGSQADDIKTDLPLTDASIGSVDVDGKTYDINPDGTVTIVDTTYTINDDGSITIGDNTYYPDYDLTPYDDTAIKDLLTDILNSIDVVDDSTDDIDDILDNVEAPAIGVDALDSMILPKAIFTVFPFCLPRDFVRGMRLFSAKPETPHFECEIKVPAFLNIPAQTWNIVIDLERFEMLARITRWLSFISFSFLLIQLSATIVKGAH